MDAQKLIDNNPAGETSSPGSMISNFSILLLMLSVLLYSSVSLALNRISLSGEFSVDQSGAAAYSVPIKIPPGSAGMVPNISLEYNNHRGDGLVGMGWSVAGLGAITRCAKTVAQDGVKGRISFSANDRFCLNGKRLVNVSGTYGMDGTVYRTENESFSRITSHGSMVDGPAWFEVETKDGRSMEYGNTTDSRAHYSLGSSQGDVAVSWSLNRVSDHSGNYYSVTYAKSYLSGLISWPVRIDYTGNTNNGLTTYNSVEFLYFSNRPEGIITVPTLFGFGGMDTLLAGIRTKNSSNTVKNYWLSYEAAPATNRLRMTRIQECGGNDPNNCLIPTDFEWQSADYASNGSWSGTHGVGASGWKLADLFGDGRKVYYTTNGSGTHYATQINADGSKQNWTWSGGHSVTNQGWKVGDIFGDGRDVFYTVSTSGTHQATQFNKDGTVQNFTWTSGHAPVNSTWELVDLFGDGRRLFYTHNATGTHYGTRVNADGSKQNWTWSGGHSPANAGWKLTDVFGEGRKVFLTIHSKPNDQFTTGYLSHRITRFNPDGTLYNYEGKQNVDQNILFEGQWAMADIFGMGRDIYYMADIRIDGEGNSVDSSVGRYWRIDPHPTQPNELAFVTYSIGFEPPVGADGVKFVDLFGMGRKFYYTYKGNGEHYAASMLPGSGIREYNWNSGQTPHGQGWEMGDLFGDGRDTFFAPDGSSNLYAMRFSNLHADVLTKITDGLGATTEIEYKPLTDDTPGYYTKDSDAVYPVRDMKLPAYTVSAVTQDNGIGGASIDTYTYTGAKIDLSGRGFLGFRKISSENSGNGIISHREYLQSWPYTGALSTASQWHNAKQLSQITQTYAQANPTAESTFVYLQQRVETRWDPNENPLPSKTTLNTYDCTLSPTSCYGNLIEQATSTSDGLAQTMINTYWNNPSSWLLGRLIRRETTSDNITRINAFEYDVTTGLLSREIVEPDEVQLRLETAYVRDTFGNIITETISSPATGQQAIASRSQQYEYDTKGRFQTLQTNALGHQVSRLYDSWFGTVSSQLDVNNIQTQSYYSDIGLGYIDVAADGNILRRSWIICGSGCMANAFYYIRHTPLASNDVTQNGAIKWVYYDKLDREVAEIVEGFDGNGVSTLIYTVTEYDALGRVARKSLPYYEGATAQWITYTYDVLNRVLSQTKADGALTTHSYAGLSQTTRAYTSAVQYQQTDKTTNSRGDVVQVTDDIGHTTSYEYNGFGDLKRTITGGSVETLLQLDKLGRKISLDDPDKGDWSYEYNPLNLLVQQTDARGRVSTFNYDLLNRMIQRTELDLVSNWYFDSGKNGTACAKGIGQLCYEETNSGFSRAHHFDTLARPSAIDTTLSWRQLSSSVTYDSNGRVNAVTYPTGLTIKNQYTLRGYHHQITDSSGTTVYWQADSLSAAQQIAAASLGNGLAVTRTFEQSTGRLADITVDNVLDQSYNYDWLGNLTDRQDDVRAWWEDVTYDSVSRLTGTSGVGYPALSLSYATNGNITSKSDVGTYSYSTNGNRPHAVKTISGTVNTSFKYNGNGAMWQGNDRTTYRTSYDKPKTIIANGFKSKFHYDTNYQRFKRWNNESGITTFYLHGANGRNLFFEEDINGAQRHYLNAGGRVVAVIEQNAGLEKAYYWHSDALGSLITVTDEFGLVIQNCSYDAFGSRSCDSSNPHFARGFTGHEHLPSGLVHMNGRLYDPELGRMLSGDPFIPSPYNPQSYNRFSYVLNNPLSYTDPSGYFDEGLDQARADARYMLGGNNFSGLSITDYGLGLVASGGLRAFDIFTAFNDAGLQLLGIGKAIGAEGAEEMGRNAQEGASSADVLGEGFIKVGDRVLIVNEQLRELGVRQIELTDERFEHIRERHSFDTGEDGASRFRRGVLNRTTSRNVFFQFLTEAFSNHAVGVAPNRQNGYAVGSEFPSNIGTTGYQYVGITEPTNRLVSIIRPTGRQGVYKVWTSFPVP